MNERCILLSNSLIWTSLNLDSDAKIIDLYEMQWSHQNKDDCISNQN